MRPGTNNQDPQSEPTTDHTACDAFDRLFLCHTLLFEGGARHTRPLDLIPRNPAALSPEGSNNPAEVTGGLLHKLSARRSAGSARAVAIKVAAHATTRKKKSLVDNLAAGHQLPLRYFQPWQRHRSTRCDKWETRTRTRTRTLDLSI